MCVNISLVASKIPKNCLSGTILISSQPITFYLAFSQFVSQSIFLPLLLFSSIFITSILLWKYKLILYSNTLHCFCMFFALNQLFIFVRTGYFSVKTTSRCLNPNLGLNLCSVVVLDSIITLIGNSLSI